MTCRFPANAKPLASVLQGLCSTTACTSPCSKADRDYGVELLKNLRVDAKTLRRWYIVTLIGQRAGHLSLGIAKGAASTVTLIPEDFEGGVDFETIADTIEASMLKRYILDRDFGWCRICQAATKL